MIATKHYLTVQGAVTLLVNKGDFHCTVGLAITSSCFSVTAAPRQSALGLSSAQENKFCYSKNKL